MWKLEFSLQATHTMHLCVRTHEYIGLRRPENSSVNLILKSCMTSTLHVGTLSRRLLYSGVSNLSGAPRTLHQGICLQCVSSMSASLSSLLCIIAAISHHALTTTLLSLWLSHVSWLITADLRKAEHTCQTLNLSHIAAIMACCCCQLLIRLL